MPSRPCPTRLAAAVLLFAWAGPADAARRRPEVPDRFDGTWSVAIFTDRGSCDRVYRLPVRIEHGQAQITGLAVVVQGGVAANGTVRGSISNGMASANVVGRLRSNGVGTGTWIASGALDCRGHWNAERRG